MLSTTRKRKQREYEQELEWRETKSGRLKKRRKMASRFSFDFVDLRTEFSPNYKNSLHRGLLPVCEGLLLMVTLS